MALGSGGQSQGPTPWWQLPENRGNRQNLEQSAPPGYTYDSVQMRYVPQTQSVPYMNEQVNKANSARQGILSSLQSMTSGSGGFGGYEPDPYQQDSWQPDKVEYNTPNGPDVGAQAAKAEEAALAKTKANAGAMGRASLESLRANLAERGILGSGTEARGLVDRLASATNPVSDANVAGLQEQTKIAEHNKDLGFQEANAQYQGEISQRGQDIGAHNASEQARLTARGQDISARNAHNQLVLEQANQRLEALKAALSGMKAY